MNSITNERQSCSLFSSVNERNMNSNLVLAIVWFIGSDIIASVHLNKFTPTLNI